METHDLLVLLKRFDAAWQTQMPPNLKDFLSREIVHSPDLVHELIKRDMEYRWRRAPSTPPDNDAEKTLAVEVLPWRPTLGDYQYCLGEKLKLDWHAPDLIVEEYRIRWVWGDCPTPESLTARYPEQARLLAEQIASVDALLKEPQVTLNHTHWDPDPNQPAQLSMDAICEGDRVDDFQIIMELGKGAFARVFLAQQLSMQRLVALKVGEQKNDESPVLAQLDHPNIVRVYDERTVGGLQMVYMQYVAGGSLRGVVDRLASLGSPQHTYTGQVFLKKVREQTTNDGIHKPATSGLAMDFDWTSTVAWIGARLCDALAHAHARGIIHLDIKPDNILIQPDGNPLLADFNLSQGDENATVQSKNRFGGTIPYMSPEQLESLRDRSTSRQVSTASDLYSLAIVLQLLATGKSPFPITTTSSDMRQVIQTHLEFRQASDGTVAADGMHDSLRCLIHRCLAYDPNRRPPSATWLHRQFELIRQPGYRKLIVLPNDSWLQFIDTWPTVGLLSIGLVSSACLSPLNIWSNHTIAIEGFDRNFFHRVQEPVVNFVLFPAGLIVAWIAIRPIVTTLKRAKRAGPMDQSTRHQAARSALRLPWVMALWVLFLWSSSGLLFPLWNIWGANSQIGINGVLGFVVSQVLHGIVAAIFTLVLLCVGVLRTVYPKLISSEENEAERRELRLLDRALVLGNAIFDVTPLLALLAIALSDQLDKRVFIVLAIVGFLGHLGVSIFVSRIRRWLDWFQIAVGPTSNLSRMP